MSSYVVTSEHALLLTLRSLDHIVKCPRTQDLCINSMALQTSAPQVVHVPGIAVHVDVTHAT